MKTFAAYNEAVTPDWKKMKDHMKILRCANAFASYHVKLTLVGKKEKPRCFKNINNTAHMLLILIVYI